MPTGMIPQYFIDELLQRVDLSQIIGSRITLKRAGTSYKACCPFHQEKTPSFHVTPSKGFYHCFGCGAHGDAISFVRELDGLSFTEAVEELAKIAGISVPRDEKQQRIYQKQQTQLSALDDACTYYQQQLSQHADRERVHAYLKGRGLNKDIIDQFRLGFAPEPAQLVRALSKESIDLLVETNNISMGDKGLYEIFHNRLMFPIRNVRGKTIAFGGRTLGNHPAKYLNSPESDIFHKKHEIYGLYEAVKANRALDQLLVVEGYMDVVALAQFGISYAVATMGTATNAENISILLKRCAKIIFCFDGDRAGQEAAHKALANCLALLKDGIEIKFLFLPDGEDPDTLIRKESKALFEQRIQKALPLSEFFFQVHTQGLGNLDTPEAKGILRERARPQIEQISAPVMKNALWDMLKKKTFTNRFEKKPFQGKQGFNNNPKFKNAKWNKEAQQINEPPPRVINRNESTLCLALYFMPVLAYEWSQYLEPTVDNDGLLQGSFLVSRRFCELIITNNIKTCAELQLKLATDSDSRNYFYNLFNTEVLPTSDIAIQEAKDAISTIKNKRRRSELVQQSSHGVLTPDERTELQKHS